MTYRRWGVSAFIAVCGAVFTPFALLAHAMAPGDKGFIMCSYGVMLGPFAYLGAKHMVTGADHLLFLMAVIFFLFRLKEIGLYVTLFALGHSVTLLLGVLNGINVNPYAIDAIIGFSVVYKALDNLGSFQRWFGIRPNTKIATLVFGLFHGMGLATKMLEFEMSQEGLIANLIAFNVGVEVGQILALSAMLVALRWWRQTEGFHRQARYANVGILIAGFVLIGYQISDFLLSRAV